jgi:hypothetical protein
MAILAAVVREPRGDNFLEGSKRAGCEHLGAERVLLELSEVGLCYALLS